MRYNDDVRPRLPALLLSLLAVFTASSAHAYSEPWIPSSSSTHVGAFTGVTPQNRIGGYQLASWLSDADLELQLSGSTRANWLSITAHASGSGLFQQRDPSGFADSVNLYAGFAWDPINHRDPTGELAVTTVLLIGAALIDAGLITYILSKEDLREAAAEQLSSPEYLAGCGLGVGKATVGVLAPEESPYPDYSMESAGYNQCRFAVGMATLVASPVDIASAPTGPPMSAAPALATSGTRVSQPAAAVATTGPDLAQAGIVLAVSQSGQGSSPSSRTTSQNSAELGANMAREGRPVQLPFRQL